MASAAGLRQKVERYAERVAAEGAAELFREIDEPVDTGQLRGAGRLDRRGRRRWRIWYPVEYASFTDTGTRPHVIRPKRAQALRFRSRGRVVFARRVSHPGTRGTGWFSKTVTKRGWIGACKRAQRRVRV